MNGEWNLAGAREVGASVPEDAVVLLVAGEVAVPATGSSFGARRARKIYETREADCFAHRLPCGSADLERS